MSRRNLSDELMQEYSRVAYYYYKINLTQAEIAKKMHMSRQRVNRILKEAVELGIVNISIEGLDESSIEIEMALEKKYNLSAAKAIKLAEGEDIHEALGIEAGKYLESILTKGDVIGFSRGRSIYSMVKNLYRVRVPDLTVTQLFANENTNAFSQGDNIVYQASRILNATPNMLYAPLVVKNKELRESICSDPFFIDAYNVLKTCKIAVVGIGTAKSQFQFMKEVYKANFESYVSDWNKDVVGEICTYYYDANGKVVDAPFRDNIIAIDFDDYMQIPYRIGVVGSLTKANAIRAALKGGLINALIVDEATAKMLL